MAGTRRRLVAAAAAVVASLAGALAWASPAAAEYVRDVEVAATVAPDTSLRIVESITYDFEGEYRHGIFRDIPLYDETLTGQRRDYDVTVTSVTMDGAATPWVLTEDGPFLNVRIGDPNTTITGAHTYVIDYTVRDALRVITEQDAADPLMPEAVSPGDVELYWDFVGTGWDVPIARARASVTGPGDVLSAVCYAGSAGGDQRCSAAAVKAIALLGPVSVAAGEALTGAVVYPRAAFSSTPQERVSQGLPSSPVVGILGALLPALALAAAPIGIALSRRRRDAGVPVPGAPPQYGPPDDLPPAELSAAWEGRKGVTDPRVLVATLLDLAARRWIDVSSDPAGDLTVTWIGTGTSPLRPWEEGLMGTILKGGSVATLTGYDKELATHWGATVRSLVEEQEALGRRNPRGDDPDRRWRWLGLVAFAVFAVGVVALFLSQAFIAAACLTAGIGAFVGFLGARTITPRAQTPASAQFLAKVDGLRTVLGTDPAASRREFAHRSGLSADAIFATMLPFAVVLGLESAWIGAFPDLTEDQLVSHGFYAGGIGSMHSFVSSGTSSMSAAMTAPSSGSGGGGSSGGGGGGGGGGSW